MEAVSSTPAAAVVIGASGYIASNVKRWSCEVGWPITVLGRRDCDLGDLRAATWALRSAGAADLPVICLAGTRRGQGDPEQQVDWIGNLVDVTGTLGSPWTCVLSSADVYGHPAQTPVPEGDPVRPLTKYGWSKVQMERRLVPAQDRCLALRIPGVWGGTADTASLISRLKMSASRGTVSVSGDGQTLRDLLHVDDLSCALRLLTVSRPVGLINISPGVPESIGELAHAIAEPVGATIVHGPPDDRSFDLVLDSHLRKTVLPELMLTSALERIRGV